MTTRKLIRVFFSLPKTIYYNFYYLPFKVAMRLPLLVSYDTRVLGGQNLPNGRRPPFLSEAGVL